MGLSKAGVHAEWGLAGPGGSEQGQEGTRQGVSRPERTCLLQMPDSRGRTHGEEQRHGGRPEDSRSGHGWQWVIVLSSDWLWGSASLLTVSTLVCNVRECLCVPPCSEDPGGVKRAFAWACNSVLSIFLQLAAESQCRVHLSSPGVQTIFFLKSGTSPPPPSAPTRPS